MLFAGHLRVYKLFIPCCLQLFMACRDYFYPRSQQEVEGISRKTRTCVNNDISYANLCKNNGSIWKLLSDNRSTSEAHALGVWFSPLSRAHVKKWKLKFSTCDARLTPTAWVNTYQLISRQSLSQRLDYKSLHSSNRTSSTLVYLLPVTADLLYSLAEMCSLKFVITIHELLPFENHFHMLLRLRAEVSRRAGGSLHSHINRLPSVFVVAQITKIFTGSSHIYVLSSEALFVSMHWVHQSGKFSGSKFSFSFLSSWKQKKVRKCASLPQISA